MDLRCLPDTVSLPVEIQKSRSRSQLPGFSSCLKNSFSSMDKHHQHMISDRRTGKMIGRTLLGPAKKQLCLIEP